MAGSRSTAPLNRSNSVLIAAPRSAFEICGYVAPLFFLQQNPSSGTVLLALGGSLPANVTVFYNPDRPCPACRQTGRWACKTGFHPSGFVAHLRSTGRHA